MERSSIKTYGELIFCAQAGQTYHIAIAPLSMNDAVNVTFIQGSSSCLLPNGDCAHSVAITAADTPIYGDTSGITIIAPLPPPSCIGTTGTHSAWFSFVGNGYTTTIDSAGSLFDTQLVVYLPLYNDCSQLECVASNDDTFASLQARVVFCAWQGTSYYFALTAYALQVGVFELTITENTTLPCQRPSSLCATATPLVADTSYSGDTLYGVETLPAVQLNCFPQYVAPFNYELYALVGNNQLVSVTTCLPGTGFSDTVMSIFTFDDAACTLPRCYAFNDDDSTCNHGRASTVNNLCARHGHSYYVQISGYYGRTVTYELEYSSVGSCSGPFGPNSCLDAAPLAPVSHPDGMSGAWGSTLALSSVGSSWFSFVGRGTQLWASSCFSSYAAQVAVYTLGTPYAAALDNSVCSQPLTLIASGTVDSACLYGPSYAATWCGLPGVTYLIRVGGGVQSGDFELRVRQSTDSSCLQPPNAVALVLEFVSTTTASIAWPDASSNFIPTLSYTLSLATQQDPGTTLYTVTLLSNTTNPYDTSTFTFDATTFPLVHDTAYIVTAVASNLYGDGLSGTLQFFTLGLSDCAVRSGTPTFVPALLLSNTSSSLVPLSDSMLLGNMYTVDSPAVLGSVSAWLVASQFTYATLVVYSSNNARTPVFELTSSYLVSVSQSPVDPHTGVLQPMLIQWASLGLQLCSHTQYIIGIAGSSLELLSTPSSSSSSSSSSNSNTIEIEIGSGCASVPNLPQPISALNAGLAIPAVLSSLVTPPTMKPELFYRPLLLNSLVIDMILDLVVPHNLAAPPTVPDTPRITSIEVSLRSMTVHWGQQYCPNAAWIETVLVTVQPPPGTNATIIMQPFDGAQSSGFVGGLLPNTTYLVSIAAINSNGVSSTTSAPQSITTLSLKYSLEWATQTSSRSSKIGAATIAYAAGTDDGSGATYVAGLFYGGARFTSDATGNEFRSQSLALDSFLTRFDADGNVVWNNHLGRSVGGAQIQALAVDTVLGVVYVTGSYSNDLYLDPNPLSPPTLNASDAYGTDLFVASYEAATGHLLWAFSGSAYGFSANGWSVAVDESPARNLLLSGQFSLVLFFETQAVADALFAVGQTDSFLALVSSNGTMLSLTQYSPGSLDGVLALASAIPVPGSGVPGLSYDILLSGSITDNSPYNSLFLMPLSNSSSAAVTFVARNTMDLVANTVSLVWGVSLGDPNGGLCSFAQTGVPPGPNALGAVYVAGYCKATTLQFVDSSNVATQLWTSGSSSNVIQNANVLALDLVTGGYLWLTVLESFAAAQGPVFAAPGSGAFSLAFATGGLPTIAGSYTGILENLPFYLPPATYQQLGLVMAFDPQSGAPVWGRWIGSNYGESSAYAIAAFTTSPNTEPPNAVGLVVGGLFSYGTASLDCSVNVFSDRVDVWLAALVPTTPDVPVPLVPEQAPQTPCASSPAAAIANAFGTTTTGSLAYPGLGSNGQAIAYPPNTDCWWYVAPSVPVYRVEAVFDSFELAAADDYVEIFDGTLDERQAPELLAYYSGTNAHFVHDSGAPTYYDNYEQRSDMRVFSHAAGSMLVHFHSGACQSDQGFALHWRSAGIAAHCVNDYIVRLINPTGQISQLLPGGYKPNANCQWLLSPATDANYIVVSFATFKLAPQDYLVFYDGDSPEAPVIATVYGSNTFDPDPPPPVQSRGPEMLVQFVSTGIATDDGFLLTYTTSRTNSYCIDLVASGAPPLTNTTGELVTQSSLTGPYQLHSTCTWLIEIPQAQQPYYDAIYLYAEVLDLAPEDYATVSLTLDSISCASSGLQSGQCVTVQAIVADTLYVSYGSSMLVTFQSLPPGNVANAGMRLRYCMHPRSGISPPTTLTAPRAVISNDFCGPFYEGNANNVWHIQPSPPSSLPPNTAISTIMFVFSTLDFFNANPSQPTDALALTEYAINGDVEQLARFWRSQTFYANENYQPSGSSTSVLSSTNLPVVVSSMPNHVDLTFTSDASGFGGGFVLEYCTVFAGGRCPQPTILSAPSGNASNAFCGGTYGANDQCQWVFQVSQPHSLVVLAFHSLAFPNENFQAQQRFYDTLTIAVDSQFVSLYTDNLVFSSAFPISSAAGTPYALPLKLSFVTNSNVSLSFASNDRDYAPAFQADYCIYTPNDPRLCSGTAVITSRSGTIDNLGCGGLYQANAACSWNIVPNRLNKAFESLVLFVTSIDIYNADSTTINDSLTIVENLPAPASSMMQASASRKRTVVVSSSQPTARRIGFYSTSAADSVAQGIVPAALVSDAGNVTLQFVSDGVGFGSGFVVSYCVQPKPVSSCGGPKVLSSSLSGTIVDRPCGATFVRPLSCSWTISPAAGLIQPPYVIVIVIETLDLGGGVLSVYDGAVPIAISSEALYGTFVVGSSYIASNGSATLVFSVGKTAALATGWSVQYYIAPSDPRCSGRALNTFTAPSGLVSDSGLTSGSSLYTNNLNCAFLITVEPGSMITVEFHRFATEFGYDFVEVYDGPDLTSTPIGYYTGSDVPPPFQSSSNSLFILFTSDESVVDLGWQLYYTTTPVCPLFCSGRGVCNNATHACTCQPGFYGLGCEVLPAPVPRHARLTPSLGSIELEFSRDTNRAQMYRSLLGDVHFQDCSVVLAPETLMLLGSAPRCIWQSNSVLIIYYGSSAAMLPGDPVTVLGGVIQESPASAYSPFAPQFTLSLLPTLQAVLPQARIMAPQLIGPSDSLVIDGWLSIINGGRSFADYRWSVDAFMCTALESLDTNSQLLGVCPVSQRVPVAVPQLSAYVAAQHTPQVMLPSSMLQCGGCTLHFTLVVTHYLGAASPLIEHYTRTSIVPVPTIAILGEQLQIAVPDYSFTLYSELSLPAELTVQLPTTGGGSRRRFTSLVHENWSAAPLVCPSVQLEWTIASGPSFLLDAATRSQSSLFIPPGSLAYNTTYTLRVLASVPTPSGGIAVGFADVNLSTPPLALQPVFDSGNQVLSLSETISLSVSLSNLAQFSLLPGASVASLSYSWFCVTDQNLPCSRLYGDEITSNTEPNLTLPAGALSIGGPYTFVCTVSGVGVISGTASADVTIVRQDQLKLQLQAIGASATAVDPTRYLQLQVVLAPDYMLATGDSLVSFAWSVVEGDLDLTNAANLLSSTTASDTLVLAPDSLVPGATLRIHVDVQSVQGRTGQAELALSVISSPMPRAMAITPLSGLITTEFRFTLRFADDDPSQQPLRYQFMYRAVSCPQPLATNNSLSSSSSSTSMSTASATPSQCPEVPLATPQAVSALDTYLPIGSYMISCYVYNIYGSYTRVEFPSAIVVQAVEGIDGTSGVCDPTVLIGSLDPLLTQATLLACLGNVQLARSALSVCVSLLGSCTSAASLPTVQTRVQLIQQITDDINAQVALDLFNVEQQVLYTLAMTYNPAAQSEWLASELQRLGAAGVSAGFRFATPDAVVAAVSNLLAGSQSSAPLFSSGVQLIQALEFMSVGLANGSPCVAGGAIKPMDLNSPAVSLTTRIQHPSDFVSQLIVASQGTGSSFTMPSSAPPYTPSQCVSYRMVEFATPPVPFPAMSGSASSPVLLLSLNDASGSSVPYSSASASDPITIRLRDIDGSLESFVTPEDQQALLQRTPSVCSFLNEATGLWDSDGCQLSPATFSSGGYYVCECSHLTNFAVLLGGLRGHHPPPPPPFAFGPFAPGFNVSEYFAPADLTPDGQLRGDFAGPIPPLAFTFPVPPLADRVPADDSTATWTWDLIAAMALFGSAVIIVIFISLITYLRPLRRWLRGDISAIEVFTGKKDRKQMLRPRFSTMQPAFNDYPSSDRLSLSRTQDEA